MIDPRCMVPAPEEWSEYLGATLVALEVSGSDLPLRGVTFPLGGSVTPIGHCSGAPISAVSRVAAVTDGGNRPP